MKHSITKFQTHLNHANEPIDAQHLNLIQDAINESERQQAEIAKYKFESDALFVLSNSFTANAIQFYVHENRFGQAYYPPNGFEWNEEQQGLMLQDHLSVGSFKTDKATGHLHHSTLNDFTLISECYVPVGATIEYYLTTKNGGFTQKIVPNSKYSSQSLPLHLKESIKDYQLTVIMKTNQANQSPILYGMVLLFHDEAVDEHFEL